MAAPAMCLLFSPAVHRLSFSSAKRFWLGLPVHVRVHSAAAATASFSSTLDEVETSLSNVFSNGITIDTNVLDLPNHQREAVAVAINVKQRLDAIARSGDCRTCWLQQKHCVCKKCPPIEYTSSGQSLLPKINRLFLLTHHKEIGLVVDTAKLLLSSFPTKSRLVVGGIGREYQPSMGEMLDALQEYADDEHSGKRANGCLVLFPSEDAKTFDQIEKEYAKCIKNSNSDDNDFCWDVVVLDGTWQQARKLYNRYIPSEEAGGGPQRVQLSSAAVAILNGDDLKEEDEKKKIPGHQLRRHPTKWREVSTLEATRLLLRDMMEDGSSPSSCTGPWDQLATYQSIADEAAQRQLGPPRTSEASIV